MPIPKSSEIEAPWGEGRRSIDQVVTGPNLDPSYAPSFFHPVFKGGCFCKFSLSYPKKGRV